MFEDATFESMGRIHTRSRGWMFAALALNTSILLAVILIPLIHPEMLPQHFLDPVLVAAPPAPSRPSPQNRAQPHPSGSNTPVANPFTPPTLIPIRIDTSPDTGPAPQVDISDFPASGGGSVPGAVVEVFRPQPPPVVVRPEPKSTPRLSSNIAAGLLIHQVIPHYPALAQQMHLEGTVVLEATISRSGTIVNLRVVSGPPLLRQAAVDAVSNWRYRPYLLNGQPVEVETTINVNFKLGG